MRRFWHLLGSMPFAVAILAVVAVAASIGSLVEQNQPFAAQVGDVGLWWATVHARLGVDDVYRAPWFLALLSLMTLSTALCVWRKTPGMWREARTHRAHLGVRQLSALPHRRTLAVSVAPGRWRYALEQTLRQHGFSWAWTEQGGRAGSAAVASALPAPPALPALSARKGMGRRLGYVLTHLGIVVIGVGGLLDGNLPLQWQRLTGDVVLAPLDASPASLPRESRIGRDGGAFRGALRLAPGETAGAVSVHMGEGQLLRELPVNVRLERFDMPVHPNGQPRDFISELQVSDPATGERRTLRVSMNKPAQYGALTFYQSGFDDGGSRVQAVLLAQGGLDEQALDVQVGAPQPVLWQGQAIRLEPTAWHPRNIVSAREVEALGLSDAFLQGRATAATRDLGPSLELAWRDASGQLREQTIYRDPIQIDGKPYLVAGTSVSGAAEARAVFLRLPLDAQGSLRTYRETLGALRDPARRASLIEEVTAPLGGGADARRLRVSLAAAVGEFMDGGFRALDTPAMDDSPQHARARRMLVELLSRAALAAWRDAQDAASAQSGQSAPDVEQGLSFTADALLGYSAWIDAGRPPLLRVAAVSAVDATVLQVTQAPGAGVVYAGMAMLGLGVVLMVLVPERRLWLRGLPDGRVLLALAAHRPMPSLDEELDAWAARLQPLFTPQPLE